MKENKKNEKLICPICGEYLEHKHINETHIYTCEVCPFIGLECLNNKNLKDLDTYFNRKKKV